MGESYIVSNLVECAENGEGEDSNENSFSIQLKLKVFSVNKADIPDLYSISNKN